MMMMMISVWAVREGTIVLGVRYGWIGTMRPSRTILYKLSD